MSNHRFPVNLDVSGKPILVVGGGLVATRKVRSLLEADAHVTVVAPHIHPEIQAMPRVRRYERTYERGEVASYRLAITCTDDPTVNAQVNRDAEAAGIWVNSADDPANCSFTLPAVVRRDDLQISISTNGTSPAVARWLRASIEDAIGPEHAAVLRLAGEVRQEARDYHGTSELDGWRDALNAELVDLVRADQLDEARRRLREALELPEEARP